MSEDMKGEALFFGGDNRIFIRNLREFRNKNIEVGLVSGTLIEGRLKEVFNDHILVEAFRGNYHIRLDSIEYVRT
jgi:hypothetical protein